MKFPVDKCEVCGFDLTNAISGTHIKGIDDKTAYGERPRCGKVYSMVEVTPPAAPASEPAPRGGRRRVSEPEE